MVNIFFLYFSLISARTPPCSLFPTAGHKHVRREHGEVFGGIATGGRGEPESKSGRIAWQSFAQDKVEGADKGGKEGCVVLDSGGLNRTREYLLSIICVSMRRTQSFIM